jgi:hypothetical protein
MNRNAIVLQHVRNFYRTPKDTQRKERQGERRGNRNMSCCVLLSVVHSTTGQMSSKLGEIIHNKSCEDAAKCFMLLS